MKRTCKWCGKQYDTSKGESAVSCQWNPRGRNYRKLKPHLVHLLALTYRRRKLAGEK